MANTKITGLVELLSPAATDVMPIVTDVLTTPVTKKVTLANLSTGLPVNAIAVAASSVAASAYATATAAGALAVTATSNAATALTTAQAAIPKSIGSSKGQIIVFTGSGTPVILGASADGTTLVCDATSASGFKFAAAATGGASATHFLISATSPTTSGDVVVTISTITAPYAAIVNIYNQSGTQVIPDSVIAVATQFTVNLYSYLATGTLAGTFGGVYIV